MGVIRMTLDQSVLDEYERHYFAKYPKRTKKPIERPFHESINKWFVMRRMAVNALKQRWKEFCVWWVRSLGYQGLGLRHFDMAFVTYMPTRRRIDPDNTVPKFILDGLTESGMIVDDDGEHLRYLTLGTGHDKGHPRTEIYIRTLDDMEVANGEQRQQDIGQRVCQEI